MPRSLFAGSCCTSCPRASSASGIMASWPDATWIRSWPTAADSSALMRNQRPPKRPRQPNQSPRTVVLQTGNVSAVRTATQSCDATSCRRLTSTLSPRLRHGDSSPLWIPHDATRVCHSLRKSFAFGSIADDAHAPHYRRKTLVLERCRSGADPKSQPVPTDLGSLPSLSQWRHVGHHANLRPLAPQGKPIAAAPTAADFVNTQLRACSLRSTPVIRLSLTRRRFVRLKVRLTGRLTDARK